MKNCKEDNFIGNRGSTLITVLVAIAFVTILTSIILGTSVMNLRMKSIDRRTKDDFYYAEKALNDIYTGIGQETAKIAGDEYEDAFKDVGLPGNDDTTFAEKAEATYKKNYIKKAAEEIKIDPAPSDMTPVQNQLKKYIVDQSGVTAGNITVTVKEYRYELLDGSDASVSTADRIRLVGVQVTTKDSKDFQATVSTDIVIETPTMDFLGPNVDVTDYCIIANKGLYINGNATINGNVYAGIHGGSGGSPSLPSGLSDSAYGAEKLLGGININGKAGSGSDVSFNGNYIVSKGDINLSGERPKLTVGNSGVSDANLPNIYFDTMRTCKGAVLNADQDAINLNSNSFALNDLELNADNSKVTIKGNYYGYNDKTLPNPNPAVTPTPVHFSSFSSETGRDDAESSAIIVNGSSATLDMKKIRSLVLMGRAYVDFSKEAAGGINIDDSTTKVAPTAEAIALKTNQQLYLVPTDLLESSNPEIKTTEFDPTVTGKGFKLSDKFSDWFGYAFADPSKPFKTYIVTTSDGENICYAYLNFNDRLWIEDTDPTNPIGYKDVTDVTDSEGKYKYRPLGTNKSISSMEAFFDIIMNSETKREAVMNQAKTEALAATPPVILSEEEAEKIYETKCGASPSPYTVYTRINKSMGYVYFDLRDCVIGDGDAILYSQNAIVNYKKNGSDYDSTMLKNTEGMERYAAYPQNLFHRYQWITTNLNAHQDTPLQTDPGVNTNVKNEWEGDGNGYKAAAEAAPLGHFVALDKIGTGTNTIGDVGKAVARGLTRNGYGDCVVKKGDLVIGSTTVYEDDGVTPKNIITVGNTFKGVAIVDGNITVQSGTTVNGLLMATGVVIIEGGTANDVISNDKGLIQARIEKEIQNVKTFPESEPSGPTSVLDSYGGYKPYYLINYLTKDTRPIGIDDSLRTVTTDAMLLYNVAEGSKKKVDRIEADYHAFMYYENWQKGPTS
ncbi:MAG: pilus assembly PilX N-terminal domain-containing protein [Lachnospiraceae bacterium]|nr:pilus assembly PilX N-terminal domain-containing protein [Lachnospiraceae bacterium]